MVAGEQLAGCLWPIIEVVSDKSGVSPCLAHDNRIGHIAQSLLDAGGKQFPKRVAKNHYECINIDFGPLDGRIRYRNQRRCQ